MNSRSNATLDALIKRLDDALSFGTTGRNALPDLLKDCKAELEARRYEEIEHEHLGCSVAKTGIYAASEIAPPSIEGNITLGRVHTPSGMVVGRENDEWVPADVARAIKSSAPQAAGMDVRTPDRERPDQPRGEPAGVSTPSAARFADFPDVIGAGVLPSEPEWYAVKDSESYSSVRYRTVLHPVMCEQEVWVGHNIAPHHAEQIARDHNTALRSATGKHPDTERLDFLAHAMLSSELSDALGVDIYKATTEKRVSMVRAAIDAKIEAKDFPPGYPVPSDSRQQQK